MIVTDSIIEKTTKKSHQMHIAFCCIPEMKNIIPLMRIAAYLRSISVEEKFNTGQKNYKISFLTFSYKEKQLREIWDHFGLKDCKLEFCDDLGKNVNRKDRWPREAIIRGKAHTEDRQDHGQFHGVEVLKPDIESWFSQKKPNLVVTDIMGFIFGHVADSMRIPVVVNCTMPL